jgi:formate dehydrogenase
MRRPYHPAYLTRERLARAPKLKLALTAGIGSDHVDIEAAREAGIAVAEVSGSNVVSVAEHVVMMILTLVRNYLPAHQQAVAGEWDVARIAAGGAPGLPASAGTPSGKCCLLGNSLGLPPAACSL